MMVQQSLTLAQTRVAALFVDMRGTYRGIDGDWRQLPGTHQCGHDSRQKRHKPKLHGRAASATPHRFAEWLVALAMWSRP